MIDMHVHILPGMDDGARSQEEALDMARRACADGTAALVATPHVISGLYPTAKDAVLEAVNSINKFFLSREVALQVLPGAEYRLEPDLPDRFGRGELLTINDNGRYLLVELPASEIPAWTSRVIYELLLQGVAPVIAHPERNQGFIRHPHQLHSLIARGALAKITAGSLTGLFGSAAATAAQLFLAHGCAHFIASDAHSNRGRAPVMSGASGAAARLLGEDWADCLVKNNPRQAVNGKSIAAMELKEINTERKSFFKRLFSGK